MKANSKQNDIILDLATINGILREKSPEHIIQWALARAERPILTSNFRPYATVLIHACIQQKKDIPVIWCDTGFNTQSTYEHIQEVQKDLNLNLHKYKPSFSREFMSYYYGIPNPKDRVHALFTELVKLGPFRKALIEHDPDVWFTNVRQGQTEHRDSLDILSYTKDGILKVSPFYHATTKELYNYTQKYGLAVEFDYYDPTKGEADNECGIQLL